MVPFTAGAYVSWKLYPAVRVSLDERYEVAYPTQWIEEVVAFYNADPGWETTLTRYATDAVLVPWYSELNDLLGDAPDYAGGRLWRCVYRDDAFSIFVREGIGSRFPARDRRGDMIAPRLP